MRMETFETSELNDNSHIRISKVKKYKILGLYRCNFRNVRDKKYHIAKLWLPFLNSILDCIFRNVWSWWLIHNWDYYFPL